MARLRHTGRTKKKAEGIGKPRGHEVPGRLGGFMSGTHLRKISAKKGHSLRNKRKWRGWMIVWWVIIWGVMIYGIITEVKSLP